MARPYAYQVLCRIEFRDGSARPRWYTVGQYQEKAQATGRAHRFCRYLAEAKVMEPPRTKPHSLLAVFEIRGPQGPWTECSHVVPKGVNVFAMMKNEKLGAARVSAPRAPKRVVVVPHQDPATTDSFAVGLMHGRQQHCLKKGLSSVAAEKLANKVYLELEWHFGRASSGGLQVGMCRGDDKPMNVGYRVATTIPKALKYLRASNKGQGVGQPPVTKRKPAPAKPRAATPKALTTPAGRLAVLLEWRVGRGAIEARGVSAHSNKAEAKRVAGAMLGEAMQINKPQEGRKMRGTVRDHGGKLIAATQWVAA